MANEKLQVARLGRYCRIFKEFLGDEMYSICYSPQVFAKKQDKHNSIEDKESLPQKIAMLIDDVSKAASSSDANCKRLLSGGRQSLEISALCPASRRMMNCFSDGVAKKIFERYRRLGMLKV